MRADTASGKCSHGNRRKRWTKRRGRTRRYGCAAETRHDADGIDVAGLALLGAHAQGRVALQMFRRAVAFLVRDAQIRNRYIVLEIDERLALPTPRQLPDGLDAVAAHLKRRRRHVKRSARQAAVRE